jgi:hypothetical protein
VTGWASSFRGGDPCRGRALVFKLGLMLRLFYRRMPRVGDGSPLRVAVEKVETGVFGILANCETRNSCLNRSANNVAGLSGGVVAGIDRRVADYRRVAYGCWRSLHLCLPIDSDQPRPPSGQADFLNNGTVLSGDDISESGEIKGVAAVAAGSPLLRSWLCRTTETYVLAQRRWLAPILRSWRSARHTEKQSVLSFCRISHA